MDMLNMMSQGVTDSLTDSILGVSEYFSHG